MTIPELFSVKEGLEKSLNDDIAFLWTEEHVADLVGQKCTHAKVSNCYQTSPVTWAMKKDFQYEKFINYQ